VKQNTQQTNKCDGGANCGNSAASTVNIGDSQNNADTSIDNNDEEPSAVEASISAATSSDNSGGNDDSGDN
jgi:ferredoxin